MAAAPRDVHIEALPLKLSDAGDRRCVAAGAALALRAGGAQVLRTVAAATAPGLDPDRSARGDLRFEIALDVGDHLVDGHVGRRRVLADHVWQFPRATAREAGALGRWILVGEDEYEDCDDGGRQQRAGDQQLMRATDHSGSSRREARGT